jgi:hypothetical protein
MLLCFIHVYGFCDDSATAAVEECRRFAVHRIWIIECFPRHSIHCVNVVPIPTLVFQLNELVKCMWRNGKMVQDGPVTITWRLSACLSVSQIHVWWTLRDDVFYHFTHSVCKICAAILLISATGWILFYRDAWPFYLLHHRRQFTV